MRDSFMQMTVHKCSMEGLRRILCICKELCKSLLSFNFHFTTFYSFVVFWSYLHEIRSKVKSNYIFLDNKCAEKSLREILNLLLRISMGKIMKSVDYITCCMPCTSQANERLCFSFAHFILHWQTSHGVISPVRGNGN